MKDRRAQLSALAMCPKKLQFRSRVSSPISSRMDWFVRCSFQLIRNMRRYDVISKALILFLSLAFKVHVSHPYVATGHTSSLIKRTFSSLLKARSFHIEFKEVIADLAEPSCDRIFTLQSPVESCIFRFRILAPPMKRLTNLLRSVCTVSTRGGLNTLYN